MKKFAFTLFALLFVLSCSIKTSNSSESSSRITSHPVPPKLEREKTSVGTASVSPDHGTTGEYGTWTVTYTVGKGGIETEGGIRVQLPDAWHAGPRNSANPLQAGNPKGNNYVNAVASRSGVKIKTEV